MTKIKAVLLDFIGTLTELVGYSLEKAEHKMLRTLIENGYNIDNKSFFDAYAKVHQKFYDIRYEQLIEVTNAIWISETMNNLGFDTEPEDEGIRKAVDVFFEDYLKALKLRPHVIPVLQKLSKGYKLGIVSNFTCASVIHAGLRELKIYDYFDVVLISDAVGWRKPSPRIFHEALRRLKVTSEETLFVGDTPAEDIKGAKNVGIRTVFISSQFNSVSDMQKAIQQPDYIIENLQDLIRILPK
ncbi:MAG: HAD family hydrolase [Candidatus Bathyarchaeota archaeon]|nr:MAG: HAD family hydrolase [Candidatus Bathyarchaeota archaeon]